VVSVVGLLLLLAGLLGGAALWVLATREPERAADAFARAAPGCRTTLSFAETGEFYVYEELSGVMVADGCEPSTTPGQPFSWSMVGPDGQPVSSVDDRSVSYELDAGVAISVARITIDMPGDHEIEVRGSDPAVVAAIGGDPDENVNRLRGAAVVVAAIGFVLGVLLLWWSNRRSRAAAHGESQFGPWSSTTEEQVDASWPPRPPTVQVPVLPHRPDDRSGVAPSAGPWAPPEPDAARRAGPDQPPPPASPAR
jgi:hypothetical protein